MGTKFPIDIIPRTAYLNKVIPFIDNRIIKVFTRQRRVGKSYLLYQIINFIRQNNSGAHIIFVSKEDLSFSEIRTAQNLEYYVLANSE